MQETILSQTSPECLILEGKTINIPSSERASINSVFYSRHIVLFAVELVEFMFATGQGAASKWIFNSECYEADKNTAVT